MALTALSIEVLDGGAPVDGATMEVRDALVSAARGTDVIVPVYSEAQATITPPDTDATGKAEVWVPNGRYEWRTTGTFVSGWSSFTAYRGVGREFYDESAPSAALPTTDAITVPTADVDAAVGKIDVTLDFADDHMGQVVIVLVPPSAPARGPLVLSGTALDGFGAPLVGAAVSVRNAVTASSVTPTDSGGTPLGSFDTDGSGNPPTGGYVPPGIYEWSVPTSANLTAWTLVAVTTSVGAVALGSLWDGPGNVAFNGLVDYAFDGTVTFTTLDDYDVATGVAFADGDRIDSPTAVFDPQGLASDGAWTLWVAGGTGTLRGWSLKLLPA
jgi:hypothetical protein